MNGTGTPEIGNWRTRVVLWFLHRFFFLRRGMTLGVRAACFDADGRVFLVRHTYVPGWYLPGGGVERQETVLAALHKEIREEGNLVATGEPELFHVYFNRRASKRDHVILYRVSVSQTALRKPDREIAAAGFFPLNALPDDVTDATARRLRELSGQAERSDYW